MDLDLPLPLPFRPRQFVGPPSLLNDFPISVELRGNSDGLSDPAKKTSEVRVSYLLQDNFRLMPTKNILPSHLDYQKFADWLSDTFKVTFDSKHCELGFKVDAPMKDLREEYFKISTESAFHNALSVMHSSSMGLMDPKRLTLYLWSPPPTVPVFRRSARAPDQHLTPHKEQVHEQSLKPNDLTPTTPNARPSAAPVPAPATPTITLPAGVSGIPTPAMLHISNDEVELDAMELFKTLPPNEDLTEPEEDDFENHEQYLIALDNFHQDTLDIDRYKYVIIILISL
jgi:hypothetical protein